MFHQQADVGTSQVEIWLRRPRINQVNALTIRNRPREVLDQLEADGKPILISSGRRARAALISVEDFQRRFVDVHAEEAKVLLLERVRNLKSKKTWDVDSVVLLRTLRGYGDPAKQ